MDPGGSDRDEVRAGEFTVLRDLADFDEGSGNLFERLIFNHRPLILLAAALVSAFLGWRASQLSVNASFERMIPASHPWIRNYLANQKSLAGLGNSVRIVVENTDGDIFDAEYLETLKQITDTIYLAPGVDRSWVKSLWMPIVRWTEVIEEGYRGGPVMPEDYDGSPRAIAELRANVMRAGIVGSLVANDLRSSLVVVPLLDRIQETGREVDYAAFNRVLEEKIRAHESAKIRVHIVGFAKLVGDLIDGLRDVIGFFAVSVAIATSFVFLYTRCVRSTLLLVGVSLLGVVWLLGLMNLLGYELDPYSILVPFLVFAIGLSHGAQKMNGIMQDIGRGTHKYVAARYTFRRLFVAGLTALLSNVVGFAVLMIIDVPVIRGLALATSLGVAVLILTKLVLIPVLLSYIGVNPAVARRSLAEYSEEARGRGLAGWLWRRIGRFTERRWATVTVVAAAAIWAVALGVSSRLEIGDLDAGAPELRPQSRYNRDVGFVSRHYGLSSDEFAVMVKTPPGGCESFGTLTEMMRLGEALRDVPGVQAVVSLADAVRHVTAGNFEANPKWTTITREPTELASARDIVQVDMPELANNECVVSPVIAYLADHRAETLARVARVAESFSRQHDQPERQFLLAAGTAGIEAATNVVVEAANRQMLLVLYSAVAALCFITFRSWRAVLVAVIPLLITSALCEALMVLLGIGVKVATLPVIALGVGVGIDYALYLLSVQLRVQRRGEPLAAACRQSLGFTGKVVGLIGLTMAASVLTWAASPIKFQADMGILLAFMFLWNMLGALLLIPALSHFLLRDGTLA
jgi:predicted RND superfamily exporter protein